MEKKFNIDDCISFCLINFNKKEVKKRLRIINYIKCYGYQGENLIATILFRDIPIEKNKEKILELSNEYVLQALEVLERRENEDDVSYFNRLKNSNKASRNSEFFYRFFTIKEAHQVDNDFVKYMEDTLKYCMKFINNSKLQQELVDMIDEGLKKNKIFKKISSTENKISKICKKYQYSYKYVHDIIFVTSKFDRWYFEYYPNIETIKLYHQNRKFSTNDYHFQRSFQGKKATIEDVLRYIKKHDDYLLYRKYDYSKIDRLLSLSHT